MSQDPVEKQIKKMKTLYLWFAICVLGALVDLAGYGLGAGWISKIGLIISLAALAAMMVMFIATMLSPFVRLFSKQKSSS